MGPWLSLLALRFVGPFITLSDRFLVGSVEFQVHQVGNWRRLGCLICSLGCEFLSILYITISTLLSFVLRFLYMCSEYKITHMALGAFKTKLNWRVQMRSTRYKAFAFQLSCIALRIAFDHVMIPVILEITMALIVGSSFFTRGPTINWLSVLAVLAPFVLSNHRYANTIEAAGFLYYRDALLLSQTFGT